MKRTIALSIVCVFCLLLASVTFADDAPAGYPAVRIDPSTGRAYDFDGATIYIYDWWSASSDDHSANPTEAQAALYAYRDWLMSTYNCHIIQKAGSDWAGQADDLINFVKAPDGSYRIYIVPQDYTNSIMNSNTVAAWNNDLIDLEDDKWNAATTDLTTINGNTYGVTAGKSQPRQLLYFNKRLLTEAGIDYNDIYDMQADGTWTWSAFTSVMRQVQRDTDSDGVNDVFGLVGSSDDFYRIAVFSNGGSFFEESDGKLTPNAQNEKTLEALNWAKSTWSAYVMPRPEEANWDWYKQAWTGGQCAFYMSQAWAGFNSDSEMSGMADPWGAVAFPIGPNGSTYVSVVSDNVAVLPKVYDAKTTAMLSMIYDLWTMPTPGYDEDDSWADGLTDLTDERAVYETYGMLRENGHCVADKVYLLGNINEIEAAPLLWSLDGYDVATAVENAMPGWEELCDTFNANNTPLAFTCSDGILSIVANAPLPDSRPWADFSNEATQIVLSGNCASICSNAFEGFANVTSVTLPISITSIGASAFNGCAGLTDVYYPGTAEQWNAIAVDNNNTPLINAEKHFNYAEIIASGTCGADGDNLAWVLDENGLLTISGTGAMTDFDWTNPWRNISSLHSVVIEEGVTHIGEFAFAYCHNLTSITIPDSVTSIGRYSFYCSDFRNITVTKNITEIGDNAFGGNSQLASIDVSQDNQNFSSYDGCLYNKSGTVLICCPGGKQTLAIPSGVMTIDGACDACYSLISVTIPESVVRIGNDTFANCSALRNVSIPSSVMSIGSDAFRYCTDLPYISLPAGITSIDDGAFSECTSLTDVYYAGTEADWASVSIGSDNEYLTSAVFHPNSSGPETIDPNPCGDNVTWTLDDEGTLVISGTGAMYDYAMPGNAPPWRWSANEVGYIVIEDGVTHIGSYAFWYCNNFNVIEIPASVTSIGQSAFANCSSMMEVDYSGSRSDWEAISIAETGNEYLFASELVCDIPDEGQISAAFDAASGRLTISGTGRMPQYQLNQNYCATNAPWYEYHDSIRSIVIESGITSISDGAFSNCSHMTEITIPNSVTDIGSYAFFGCSSLTGISIPGGVVSIRTETFAYCTSLTNVTFPDDLLLIENAAFTGCSGLTSIVFPSKLTAIRSQAFYGCSGLTSITLPASLRSIGNVAFTECGLTEINVSGSATTFHFFYADDNGNHLYHINLPSGLTSLESTAFYANPLRYDTPDFVLPSNLTAIEAEAFSGTDARFVWLPEGITSIGANAFANSQVKYVYIPYGCNSIGAGAFPAGTIILGDFNSEWDAGYAKTWAEQNGCIFILLDAPFSGNG